MFHGRRPWTEELEIVDALMRSVSDLTDPQEMVERYWDGVEALIPIKDYVALSRRGVTPPEVIITRSSRFVEHPDPWTERERLPRVRSGLLHSFAYADRPMVVDDLPAKLATDDPGRQYLEGFQTAIVLPQYERGAATNISVTLVLPGVEFDRSFVPMMHWQASLFGRATLGLVLQKRLTEALATLDRELEVVGEIQRSLLPREVPSIPGVELAAYYRTSQRAGGDAYDFFPVGARQHGIFISDVSGHGTPAAVLMAVTHAIAHTRPGHPTPPGELLEHLNHHLERSYTGSGAFVTAFYATLDPAAMVLRSASAGHNPPRLLRDGTVHDLAGTGAPETSRASSPGGGLPLGIMAEERYAESTTTLRPGDLLFFYTDGITEAMAPGTGGESRELFGTERLDAVLRGCGAASAQQCIDAVCAEVERFTQGTPPTDDRTIVVMKCVRG